MIQKLSNIIGLDMGHFLRHGPWLLLSDGVQQVSGVIMTLFIARVATQEALGQFQLILSVMAMVAVVSIRGIDIVVMRDSARKLDGVYKRAIRVRLAWSLLSVPIMFLISYYYQRMGAYSLAVGFGVIAIFMPFHYLSQSWQSFYKGKELFNQYAVSSILRSLLTLFMVSLTLIVTGGNIVAVLMVYVGMHLIVNSATMIRSFFVLDNDAVSLDWKDYSYFLSKAGFFKQIVTNIDKVLVGVMFSPAVLALYAVATIIPNSLMLSFKSLFTMIQPKLSKRKYLKFRDLFIALLVGIFVTFVTMLIVIFLLVPLFGERYRVVMPIAVIASLALLFLPLSQLLVSFASMQGRKKAIIANQLFSPAIKLILILILGSTWQVTGFVVVFAMVPLIWSLLSLLVLEVDFKRMIVT